MGVLKDRGDVVSVTGGIMTGEEKLCFLAGLEPWCD